MANTYHQMYAQIIFSTRGREKNLSESFRGDVFKYIHGILENHGLKALAVNGYSDHVHIFTSLRPDALVSDLVREIKTSSNHFIREKFIRSAFNWQIGYGIFTYSRSEIDDVIKYVMNQSEHHKIESFKDEYLRILKQFGVDYNLDYVFD